MAVSILPPLGQFLDNDGAPLNGGTVTVQDAGTTNSRNIYTDTGLSVAATNPVPLDSAGRPTQGVIYTAASAYKLILKNSGGSALRTEDNLDPGVPIGSGYLAIANGGTGATSAGTALSNLGGATAAELADLAADVAALVGASASSEKTTIAKGTTAQRPGTPETGHIRYNTTTSEYEFYTGSGWDNVIYTSDLLAGSVVKSSYTAYSSSADITATIPYDDTIPQIGEGTEIITVSFTPTSATNILRIRFSGFFSASTNVDVVAALFGGGAADAIAATAQYITNNNLSGHLVFEHQEVSGTASAKTFAVRAGPASAGTVRFNGTPTARRFGGVAKAVLIIEEIKV